MKLAGFTTVDFDKLSYESMMETHDKCAQIEASKTPLSGLSIYQLESMIWYYQRGLDCVSCDQPESWSEEREYRYEAMRCAEAIALIFQRRYEAAKKNHDEWIANPPKSWVVSS